MRKWQTLQHYYFYPLSRSGSSKLASMYAVQKRPNRCLELLQTETETATTTTEITKQNPFAELSMFRDCVLPEAKVTNRMRTFKLVRFYIGSTTNMKMGTNTTRVRVCKSLRATKTTYQLANQVLAGYILIACLLII